MDNIRRQTLHRQKKKLCEKRLAKSIYSKIVISVFFCSRCCDKSKNLFYQIQIQSASNFNQFIFWWHKTLHAWITQPSLINWLFDKKNLLMKKIEVFSLKCITSTDVCSINRLLIKMKEQLFGAHYLLQLEWITN